MFEVGFCVFLFFFQYFHKPSAARLTTMTGCRVRSFQNLFSYPHIFITFGSGVSQHAFCTLAEAVHLKALVGKLLSVFLHVLMDVMESFHFSVSEW